MGSLSILSHALVYPTIYKCMEKGRLFYALRYPIEPNPILLCYTPQTVPALAFGEAFQLVSVSLLSSGHTLIHVPVCAQFFFKPSYFLALQDAAGSSCIFPTLVLESSNFSKEENGF